MKRNTYIHQLLAGSMTALVAASYTASAYPIDVPNWSFEVPRGDFPDGLAEGEDVYMEPVLQSWHQYDVNTNGGPQRYWNPAADPTAIARFADRGFGGIAPDGDHVGISITRYNDNKLPDGTSGPYVRDYEALAQVLEDVLFDPAETYTLTVKVGHPPGKDGDPDKGLEDYDYNGYAVQLLAGGEEVNPAGTGLYAATVYGGDVIAEDFNSTTIAVNTFETITVTYTPGSLDPGIADALTGLPLQIRLCALEGPDHAVTSIVAFDMIELDGPPPTPKAVIVAPGTGETDFNLAWDSYEGREYNVLSSADLTAPLGSWTPVATGLAAAPPTNTYSVAPVGPTQFYRIEQVPAPPAP